MLDEKLKEEFKGEEEKKEGAGKQFNETVASSEVGRLGGYRSPAASGWGEQRGRSALRAALQLHACGMHHPACPPARLAAHCRSFPLKPGPLQPGRLSRCCAAAPQGTQETVVIISSGKKKGTNATTSAAGAAADAATAGGHASADAAAAAAAAAGGAAAGSEVAAAHAAYESTSAAAAASAAGAGPTKQEKQKELEEQIEAAAEADVDRIIDSKDNEYVLSKPGE